MIPSDTDSRTPVSRLTLPSTHRHESDARDTEAGAGGPEERAARVARVQAALSQLSSADQIVLDLLYRQEFRLREVSLVLGISECRVARLRTAARSRLRVKLRGGSAGEKQPSASIEAQAGFQAERLSISRVA